MKKPNTKRLQVTQETYLQFTEDELKEFGWKPGQRLFITDTDDGDILISSGESIDIDFEEFTKEELVHMIETMNDADQTVAEYIESVLEKAIL